jgi:hypothetical protein
VTTAELVPSVSIENLVNQRAAVVERINAAIELIKEASKIAGAANLGMPRFMLSTGYGHNSHSERDLAGARLHTRRDGSTFEHDGADRAEIDKLVRLGVDSAAWQYLMHESGLRTLMDATAREKWDKAIREGDIPELNGPNVRSTFTMLHDSRGEMFERGVIACFKSLAWDYKTNLPQKFGKRIVVAYLTGSSSYRKCDELDDLVRVFSVLDGKPEPDHRNGIDSQLRSAGLNDWVARKYGTLETDYMSIKTFKNGNGHITFKRLDLVERMNKIIASHYPGALPAPK